ncbi:DNA-binding protein [Streptomyces sp. AC627_RSS907]|uniref:DNA-binding protein n=1 Tax=Streptomyces sp. AC627_RSS907 TaxID=2823684 RepID=UPI001C24B04F|nr:DNA-binding protein [Streptomyces sp. AC627_RSS907]
MDSTKTDTPAGGGTTLDTEKLLRAGAVLPPGTAGGGVRAVPVVARTYRHPALADDQVVVRLVSMEPGEDPGTGFLGLETEGEPVEVGVAQPRALGFPEWVLVHHPEDGHLAMTVVERMEKISRTARSSPKRARASFEKIGRELAGAVPHFLPTFYEQAGRVFLDVDEKSYASMMFSNARKAETAHGLPFDEERMDAVFLEFSLADAVQSNMLSSYAKGLPSRSRMTSGTALRHVRGLFVRLAAHGLAPSGPGVGDLRRLAKAAVGKGAFDVEVDHLRQMLVQPGTAKAPTSWWTANEKALRELIRREPAFRGVLLGIMPSGWKQHELTYWAELLEETGALAGLFDTTLPSDVRPPDGTAGWARSLLEAGPPRDLYPLFDRMAGVLRAELAAGDASLPAPADAVLLDRLLALGIPLSAPEPWEAIRLDVWAREDDRSDLLALRADARFRPAFRNGCDRYVNREEHALLAASPGGRPMLADWVAHTARAYLSAELSAFSSRYGSPLYRLQELSGEILAVAEAEVRAALAPGLAPALTRTLRSGILDELGWSAWDEAVEALGTRNPPEEIAVADAWPHLVLQANMQVRVIGEEGAVLAHTVEVPDGTPHLAHIECHYVDGELGVYWQPVDGSDAQVSWPRGAPEPVPSGRPVPRMSGVRWSNEGTGKCTLPLPGGGRTTGGGVVRPGDSVFPPERELLSDGTSFWVLAQDSDHPHREPRWYTYDPVTDTLGGTGMPGWFSDGLRAAPPGSRLLAARLLPLSSAEPGPLCAPVDGLIGWRVLELPDGSRRAEDLAGRTIRLPAGTGLPRHALEFPGTGHSLAVICENGDIKVLDGDGTVMAVVPQGAGGAPGFAAGTRLLPPQNFWHLLRPRDPQGSAALRRIGEETVTELLTAAVAERQEGAGDEPSGADGPSRLLDLIRTLLPEVEHHALRTGIAGVVRYAAEYQSVLDTVRARLDAAVLAAEAARETGGGQTAASGSDAPEPSGPRANSAGTAPRDDRPEPPGDETLARALGGLDLVAGRHVNDYWHCLFDSLGLIGDLVRTPTGTESDSEPPSLDPIDILNWRNLPSMAAPLALRAASRATPDVDRAALHAYFAETTARGLAELNPAHWRVVLLEPDTALLKDPRELHDAEYPPTVRVVGDGAFLLFCKGWEHTPQWNLPSGGSRTLRAVHHDPAGRFETPAPYLRVADGPFVPEPKRAPGWSAVFLAELAERGPAPWFPEAAETFARLTGTTPTMARLLVAGMPRTGDDRAMPTETLKTIGVQPADVRLGKDLLQTLAAPAVRRAVLDALLPTDPTRLWTDGPDAVAAAEVWNSMVGRRTPVPEEPLRLAAETMADEWWWPYDAVRAFLHADTDPRFHSDVLGGHDGIGASQGTPTLDVGVLKGTAALTACLAHRLPVGDPVRTALAGALAAVRDRLADPEVMVALHAHDADTEMLRRLFGEPVQAGEHALRYGPVVVGEEARHPHASFRSVVRGEDEGEPLLEALFGSGPRGAEETALRLLGDERFAALLADPGEPGPDARDEDGRWWPQHPGHSVPALVAEVAERYGIDEDAAVLYLMVLAMPDPTDRNTALWTGWPRRRGGTARLRAARDRLAATGLVVEGRRTRAGRTLFLPGEWVSLPKPHIPLERWKLPLHPLLDGENAPLGVVVPTEPAADLYRRAWQRVVDGDGPRFEEVEAPRPRKRR